MALKSLKIMGRGTLMIFKVIIPQTFKKLKHLTSVLISKPKHRCKIDDPAASKIMS